jgi:small subunit ribosomal protein S16
MLAIKLKRIGKKHQASFRIIVAEKRSKLQGRYVEDLGWWNPHSDKFEIKKERADYWVKNGAQPTDSVFNLLVDAGVIAGPKKAVHKKAKKDEETAPLEKTEA